ncbi:MAG: RDD family protein [Campylobacteraceae bacterium]|jgi:uncharacterized RDD family membrane protein YckC|nr:RDD family protein [Campylobacteraceae bacterium]
MTEEELVEKFKSENITLSPLYKRVIAHAIDEFIIACFMFFAFYGMLEAASSSEEALSALVEYLAPYIVLMKIIYQTFFVRLYGATVGKTLMKIRIISMIDGQNPNIFLSLIRANMRILSEAVFFIGFLWALNGFKKQTWEDIGARTLVVNA